MPAAPWSGAARPRCSQGALMAAPRSAEADAGNALPEHCLRPGGGGRRPARAVEQRTDRGSCEPPEADQAADVRARPLRCAAGAGARPNVRRAPDASARPPWATITRMSGEPVSHAARHSFSCRATRCSRDTRRGSGCKAGTRIARMPTRLPGSRFPDHQIVGGTIVLGNHTRSQSWAW